MKIRLTTTTTAAAAFAALLACSMPTPAQAEDGAELWRAKCKGCHGEDGKGKTKIGEKEKIDDLTSPDWQKNHSDDRIKQVIRDGSEKNPKMKPFKDKLTDQEIDSLVKYIRTLK
jgi:cytochrome c553